MNHTRRNRLMKIFYEVKESMDDLHSNMQIKTNRHGWTWHLTKIAECRQQLLKAQRMLENEQQGTER